MSLKHKLLGKGKKKYKNEPYTLHTLVGLQA